MQVGQSKGDIQRGTTELVMAKRYQKRTRRLMACGLLLLVVIGVIIAVAVVCSLHPWSH